MGNGIEAAAIPCLFAMGNTIADERYSQTLGCCSRARRDGSRSSSDARSR